ncbi:MAG TPA: hypothetical protein ENJ09_13885 [Planctomycetes bacterium]|nr:hypothetical protein [Planctomycetota bacterium]
MKEFFQTMTLPRAVILCSLIASIVLGYFAQQKSSRLEEIQRELAQVPSIAKEIQRLGIEVQQYQELAQGSTTGADFDFSGYIRSIAADDTLVGIGQVSIDPITRTPSKDIEDKIYRIRPANQNQRYQRSRIGNFLYKLEADSRRVKVTSIKITPAEKNRRPGEIGSDEWTFEASITSRSQVSSGS